MPSVSLKQERISNIFHEVGNDHSLFYTTDFIVEITSWQNFKGAAEQ